MSPRVAASLSRFRTAFVVGVVLAVLNPFCCYNSFWIKGGAPDQETSLKAFQPCVGKPDGVRAVVPGLAVFWIFLACLWLFLPVPVRWPAWLRDAGRTRWTGPPRHLALRVIRV